jgi:hypothetical protein
MKPRLRVLHPGHEPVTHLHATNPTRTIRIRIHIEYRDVVFRIKLGELR